MILYPNINWFLGLCACICVYSLIVLLIDDKCFHDTLINFIKVVAGISGAVVLVNLIIVLLDPYINGEKLNYQELLDRKTKAERTIEKYLIDHPELRELKIDENNKIIEE